MREAFSALSNVLFKLINLNILLDFVTFKINFHSANGGHKWVKCQNTLYVYCYQSTCLNLVYQIINNSLSIAINQTNY